MLKLETLANTSVQLLILAFLMSFSPLLASSAYAAESMSLEDVIKLATKNSEAIQASDKSIESIDAEIAGRDLLLSPRLTAEVADAQNSLLKANSTQPPSHSRLLDVSLTKLFSTGTLVALTAGHENSLTNSANYRNIGNWEVRLTQSLWRDGFGRGTSLRHDAEDSEKKSRVLNALYERQSFLVQLESAYWDLVLALKQQSIRLSNIEKSEQIERWTRNRVRRSAAEQSDLVQAQALVSSRRLELLGNKNQIDSAKNRLRELIPNQNPDQWTLNLSALEQTRPLTSLVDRPSGSAAPMRLNSLSAMYLARQSQVEAEQVSDKLNPQLDAYVSYGQNGADERFSTSWNNAVEPDFTSTRVGVQLSVDLDVGLKNQQRRAVRLNAESNALIANAQKRSSEIGWSDLARQTDELKKQVEESNRLADLQQKKVQAERSRYNLGRSTVFQLITFEVDAANAQVSLYQIMASLRKLESQARVFTQQQDGK
jgi:outer membrane protein TolC